MLLVHTQNKKCITEQQKERTNLVMDNFGHILKSKFDSTSEFRARALWFFETTKAIVGREMFWDVKRLRKLCIELKYKIVMTCYPFLSIARRVKIPKVAVHTLTVIRLNDHMLANEPVISYFCAINTLL